MSVEDRRAVRECGAVLAIKKMSVGQKQGLSRRFEHCVVGEHRKFEQHLIDFAVAVPPYAKEVFLHAVQKFGDRLRQ